MVFTQKMVVDTTSESKENSKPQEPTANIPGTYPAKTTAFLIDLKLQWPIFRSIMGKEPILYRVAFSQPVCIEGYGHTSTQPFMASCLLTGEGDTFRNVRSIGSWDFLDVLLKPSQSKAGETSSTLKVTLVVPKAWNTHLVLALIVNYLKDEDTLRFHRPSGRIRDIFDWFVQDPCAVENFLTKEEAYKAIEVKGSTA
jgi:hypothetical protein